MITIVVESGINKKVLDKTSFVCYNKDTKGKEMIAMIEYEIYNETANEWKYIYGYSVEDAFRRCPGIVNSDEWKVTYSEYID